MDLESLKYVEYFCIVEVALVSHDRGWLSKKTSRAKNCDHVSGLPLVMLPAMVGSCSWAENRKTFECHPNGFSSGL